MTPIARKAKAGSAKAPAASKKLLGLIEKSLDDDKAENIVAIDLTGKSSIADYMVIASGRSGRQRMIPVMILHRDRPGVEMRLRTGESKRKAAHAMRGPRLFLGWG